MQWGRGLPWNTGRDKAIEKIVFDYRPLSLRNLGVNVTAIHSEF